MSNLDNIEIEAEAFNLIDSTAQQVEQLTAGKPKVVGRFVVEYDGAEMAKFGSYMIATTCEEILIALESGISPDDLKGILKAAIASNRGSAGVQNDSSR